MRENFAAALAFTLREEGGFVDDPRDPGGATNKGITLATYRAYFGNERSIDDLYRIDEVAVAHIYNTGYWAAVRGDDLPPGIDLMVFDEAVNAGPRRSVQLLQRAAKVEQDGRIGPETLSAASVLALPVLAASQQGYYERLMTFMTFGRGWTRRVDARLAAALALVPVKARLAQPDPKAL